MRGRVLVVAGSDSGGGAGIQADIKTIAAFGGYSTTAITALTAQDTHGVHAVFQVPPAFVRQQMELTLADIGTDAVKTGMLGDGPMIEAVAEILAAQSKQTPIVVDPVMFAKGGASLLENAALNRLKDVLIPLATVLTPNIPEAQLLTGISITSEATMLKAAESLLGLRAAAVLLKGGHLPGDDLCDILLSSDGMHVFRSTRIQSRHTHGTGCTLASAIAVNLAQGATLLEAVGAARNYVRNAITSAPGFGSGHGPLNHSVTTDLASAH